MKLLVENATKGRFMPPLQWSETLLLSNPIFADLTQQFPIRYCECWPSLPQLNQWRSDNDYCFVENALLAADGRYYEEFIYGSLQIPTRAENWHDFFGALIWCLFPKTKALLNQLHMTEIAQHGQKQRSRLRNKLTLFDECGVILCLEPEQLVHAELLRRHQWQQSFIERRNDWWQGIRPVIFGHAIYEMATAPYIGLTAKALFIEVPQGFNLWPLPKMYAYLDKQLQSQIKKEVLLDTEQLTPLPLLGVPDWHSANAQTEFYFNEDYFRPKRAN